MAAASSEKSYRLKLVGEGPSEQILNAFNEILDLRKVYTWDRQQVNMTLPCSLPWIFLLFMACSDQPIDRS